MARWLVVAVLLVGCGSDPATASSTGGDGGGGSGGGGAGGAEPNPITISGYVTEWGAPALAPVGDAAVSIVDAAPPITAVSAQDGSFTLTIDGSAAGTTVYVRAGDGGHASVQRPVVLTPAGTTDVALALVPSPAIAYVSMLLGIPVDPQNGEVLVSFATPSADGGLGATLDAVHDPSFTFDATGSPVVSDTTLPNGEAVLVFPNSAPGVTRVSPTATAGQCELRDPVADFRVDPMVFTWVDVDCAAR
jgi:hypothetical protein